MARSRAVATAAVVVGLAAAVLLVASTGATILDGPSDPISDDVALQPGENPYTYLDENDELVVDITEENPRIDADGVNPDAFSAQRALFYITYDGDDHANAWIDHDAEAVTFTVDGEPVESREDAARLTPDDDAVAVGVEVDTRIVDAVPGDRLIDSISVHAETPSDDDSTTESAGGSSGPVVTMTEPSPDARTFDLRAVVGGADTELDLAGMHVGGDWIRLDRLSFVRDAPGDVEMRVAGAENRPADTGAVPPGVDPLGYYTVEFGEPDQPIREATATLAVDRDRLDEAGVEPEALVAYHDAGEGWERTATRVVATDSETVRLAVDSDGFSSFALATESPAIEPGSARLGADEIEAGEELSIELDVENVGPAPATGETLRVETAGETPVTGGTFTIDADPGGPVTESVTVSIDEPGVHELVIDGDRVTAPTTVGSVAVTSASDSDEGADDSEGTDGETSIGSGLGDDSGEGSDASSDAGSLDPAEEPAGFDLTDATGLVALLAIVLATLFLVRRAPR